MDAESADVQENPYVDVVFDVPLNQVFSYRKDAKNEACPGKRVMAPFGRREALGYVIAERKEPPPGVPEPNIKQIRRVVDKEPVFEDGEAALAFWMAGYYLCGAGEALAAMVPSGRRSTGYASFSDDEPEITEPGLHLSEEQRSALEAILGSSPAPPRRQESAGDDIRNPPSLPPPEMFYLYGITGSGKTEVFLRAAEAMLRDDKSVLYLVPEISLTHQTAEAIGRRFGAVACTIHSGMTPSARLAEWVRIRRGEIRIVVGPRSAVFAPVRNLGLVIIDEEHDGSYKSGNTPRYHARQVAMRRCSAAGAKLVMGSATPSVEAWKLMNEGAIRRLNLTRRLSGGSPPEIIPVSLENTDGCLSSFLKDEILNTARMGRQTILFLNRRGFAYFYHCKSCGFELTCRNCSVSLTYHKSKGRAVCHYCGYSVTPPGACPECGSLEAGFTGFGTEMIEEEVRRTFPDLRIRRADADTTGAKDSLKETLDIFRAGGIDILLGTQMVAKGLNFPGVRLVGVVMADTGLHLPDFRAAERTFSLIVQVAGRAGRYFPDGKVIVQTMRPHDPAIVRACALDVDGFFEAEISQREVLGFPPHTRLIRFTLRSKEADRADRAVRRLAAVLGPLVPKNGDMLGPAECPIGVIAGNHRRQLILRGKNMGALHRAARTALERYEKNKDSRVYLEVDVDPVSLL
ncbi:replication restart helicase PriA [Breznakiella homolactica]|uniref:Replication restart protein PriA n=1 Tax=Breznakiella homolactica TaxID=2798577 RepID=A0A7T8B8L1_9SPIR|nr:primosomal protein N' [Breznakiella homolactica]QQO07487.1 primosomal protein N' [Breznakiella homolactica]